MKKLINKMVVCAAVLVMLSAGTSLAEAAGKGSGRGQMLRDGTGSGTGTGNSQQWQGSRGTQECPGCGNTGANPKGGYGDGTQPRPMDGTGFGKKR